MDHASSRISISILEAVLLSSGGIVVVSGAAGKTGRAIIGALQARGAEIRPFVRRAEQRASFPMLAPETVVVGDMRDPASWSRALRGGGALYLICPNMVPDERDICEIAIAAARDAGVERVVYHSVLHPQIEDMPHHWNKMRVEARLFTSGLRWTVVQPAPYMQNVFTGREAIVGDGLYRVPYAVETRLGMVDLNDVADVAARVLTEPGHAGATYELAGAEILTQTEIAEILVATRGQPVRAARIPLDEWERNARAAGLGGWQIATLVAMFRYYERHGFWGNPHVLTSLLSRPPASFAEVAARELT